MVSHDRAFLDATAHRIIEIDPDTHTIREFTGNYTDYVEQKIAERERQFPLQADLGEAEPDDSRAAGRDTRYPRITLDEIVAAQPELILLPDEPYLFQETDAVELYQLDIPAAHLGHIYLIDGSLLSWHGTRFAFTLTELPPMIEEVHEKLGHTHKDESD